MPHPISRALKSSHKRIPLAPPRALKLPQEREIYRSALNIAKKYFDMAANGKKPFPITERFISGETVPVMSRGKIIRVPKPTRANEELSHAYHTLFCLAGDLYKRKRRHPDNKTARAAVTALQEALSSLGSRNGSLTRMKF